MGPMRIVTDSMARFARPELLGRYPVTIVPMRLETGAGPIEDTPDIEAWEALRPAYGARLPRLLPPSVDVLGSVYSQLLRETDQILSIHGAVRVSAAVNNASAASQQFLGRCDIQVVDSHSFSVGQGLLVEAAIEEMRAKRYSALMMPRDRKRPQ